MGERMFTHMDPPSLWPFLEAKGYLLFGAPVKATLGPREGQIYGTTRVSPRFGDSKKGTNLLPYGYLPTSGIPRRQGCVTLLISPHSMDS